MSRALLLVGLAALGLAAGCRSSSPGSPAEPYDDDDDSRVVERAPLPEPPRPRRFELVETAVLESSSDPKREVEISIPIASTDPGVQTIESMIVRITPDQTYDVSHDMDGNRVIHVHCKSPGSVSIELNYRVEVRSFGAIVVGIKTGKSKPLTETEKRLFARELSGRKDGIPTRAVKALALGAGSDAETVRLEEVYFPGVGWFVPLFDVSRIPPDRFIVIARGGASGEPAASAPIRVSYHWRDAPER